MRYPEYHYRWTWQAEADPESLWPLVSDTNRFNHDTDVPALHFAQMGGAPALPTHRTLPPRSNRESSYLAWDFLPYLGLHPNTVDEAKAEGIPDQNSPSCL